MLFLMDHAFLANDHLALNETTFTWPERVIEIIKVRYAGYQLSQGVLQVSYFSRIIQLHLSLSNCEKAEAVICVHLSGRELVLFM